MSWSHEGDCGGGGGGNTAVRYGDRLYARDGLVGTAYKAQTGGQFGYSFLSASIPAFARDIGVFIYSGTMTARHADDGRELWTFEGDGKLGSNPVIVDGIVYVGSRDGMLYGVDVEEGTQVWSMKLERPIASPSYDSHNEPKSGFGVAPGVLLVPSGSSLVALEG